MTTLQEKAALIKSAGEALLQTYTTSDLRAVWRRLPNVTATWEPTNPKRLAESVALHLYDLGFDGPQGDLKVYIAETAPLRGAKPGSPVGAKVDESVEEASSAPVTEQEGSEVQTPKEVDVKSTKAKKAAPAKKPAAEKAKRGEGPRAGTAVALIIGLAKKGTGVKAIMNAVARDFPDTKIGEASNEGDARMVSWYLNYGKKKGWLNA